jgi:hypothetical protein
MPPMLRLSLYMCKQAGTAWDAQCRAWRERGDCREGSREERQAGEELE